MALNDERTDFVVPALELAEWLEKYDRWFKQASGIEQGRNLHLLYNRTSSINCAGILRTADTLPALLRAATRTGIQLRVSTVLSECVELEPQLNKLLDAGLNSISLYFDREDVAGAEAEACRHLMENLASRSINLLLIGYISGWERRHFILPRRGLLSHSAIGSPMPSIPAPIVSSSTSIALGEFTLALDWPAWMLRRWDRYTILLRRPY
jgi:hypothetical protein